MGRSTKEQADANHQRIVTAAGNLFRSRGYDAVAIADVMEEWFTDRACDGFVLVPPYFPAAFDEFAQILQGTVAKATTTAAAHASFTATTADPTFDEEQDVIFIA